VQVGVSASGEVKADGRHHGSVGISNRRRDSAAGQEGLIRVVARPALHTHPLEIRFELVDRCVSGFDISVDP
jgi:hypothetical protein